MARAKGGTVNKPSISFRKMLEMEPQELRQLDPDYFQYARAKDIAKLSDEQLFALSPEQVKYLKPISFSEVDPDKLRILLARLSEQVKNEDDIWNEEVLDDDGKPVRGDDGNIVTKERYGAQETIRRAIIKSEKFYKEQEKIEKLRRQEGVVEGTNDLYADVVWAKLNITMRYLYILAEQGEISMYRPSNRHICDTQSVLDYLNRQRRPGATLDDNGKPIHLDVNGDRCWLDNKSGKWMTVEGKVTTPAVETDESGKERDVLERVVLEPLTDIPNLYPVEEFAERLRMDARSFIRNCNDGYYDHIRIGTVLKMSEEDFTRSMARIKEATTIRGAGRTPKALEA